MEIVLSSLYGHNRLIHFSLRDGFESADGIEALNSSIAFNPIKMVKPVSSDWPVIME
jgi:hypothetical protein